MIERKKEQGRASSASSSANKCNKKFNRTEKVVSGLFSGREGERRKDV